MGACETHITVSLEHPKNKVKKSSNCLIFKLDDTIVNLAQFYCIAYGIFFESQNEKTTTNHGNIEF